MQKRHQLRHVAVGRYQLVIHVARVRSHIAQTFQIRNFRKAIKQAPQFPRRAVFSRAVIGVDVLAKQRDLACTIFNQSFGFGDNGFGPREYSAPRV